MRQKPKRYTTFFERRRARQARGDAGRSYTFELAALHLQLLIAMAAVDDEIRSIEVDEILGFIDRTSLAHDDITRLSTGARSAGKRGAPSSHPDPSQFPSARENPCFVGDYQPNAPRCSRPVSDCP